MAPFLPHDLLDNRFVLTAGRSIFWENEQALILSDLHIGKSGHFRKSGIAIPQSILLEDMQRLLDQVQNFKPSRIIVVGDLFHSHANRELDLFMRWRDQFSQVPFQLVMGNHDILQADWYQQAGIDLFREPLLIKQFAFIHDISDLKEDDEQYYFSGHIHPGYHLNGSGRQHLQLPCYYFGKKHAVLPAFGKFTGTHSIRPKKGEAIYVLVNNQVMRMQ